MIEIVPIDKLDADIIVPGSKYIANRVLIISALAKGKSIIKNVPDNEDINNSIMALKSFGADIQRKDDLLIISGNKGKLKIPGKAINVGDSGTLLRFITGVAAICRGKVKITGSKRIQERPINDLISAFSDLGVKTKSLNKGKPPVVIEGGTLKGGKIKIKGDISSQYISSLLLVASYAKEDVEIILKTEVVSKNYIDLTIQLMEDFGVKIERKGYSRFLIKSGQRYRAREYVIQGDWSSASYFLAAGAIVPGRIRIKNIDLKSRQGESRFYSVLKKMGCKINKKDDWIEVIGPERLIGIDIDMGSMPDTVQTLCSVACFAEGTTSITNIGNLRYKESDRINDTALELKKLGINVKTKDDSITIKGGNVRDGIIDTHNDHRTAMSFALIGLKVKRMKINNPEVVNKSFPGYWDKLKEIGAEIKYA